MRIGSDCRCDCHDYRGSGDYKLDYMKTIVERMSGRRIDTVTQRDFEPGRDCHRDDRAPIDPRGALPGPLDVYA